MCPNQGAEPVIWACAPTRNQTADPSLCGTMPKQLSHTAQGNEDNLNQAYKYSKVELVLT